MKINKCISAKIYKWQLRFERHPLLLYFAIVTYLITFIALSYYGLYIWQEKGLVLIALIAYMIISLFTIYYDLHIIKRSRFELQERRKLISDLVNFDKNIYKVKYRKDMYDIKPNGDAEYTREMVMEYDKVEVAWAMMLFGSTNEFGQDFKKMIVDARTFPGGESPLSLLPIDFCNPRIIFAVILKQKLTNTHREEGYKLTVTWPSAWKLLMESNEDDGIIRIDHDTSEYILEITLPTDYSFDVFEMPGTKGEPTKGKSSNGRNFLVYRLSNLKKGNTFSYDVKIKKDA